VPFVLIRPILKDSIAKANELDKDNACLATHLRSSLQTATALGIVQRSIIEEEEISRDRDFEDACLSQVVTY